MLARDPDEPHRAASSLELLFDLVFVVAVSQASGALHHLWEEQHFTGGVLTYAMVFFAIFIFVTCIYSDKLGRKTVLISTTLATLVSRLLYLKPSRSEFRIEDSGIRQLT